MKSITISVINDLVTDQRLHRMAGTISREGYSVKLLGRQLKHSLPLEGLEYSSRRFKMVFTKGPFFYLFYNIRLFFFLLFRQKPDLLVSIDLDTLLANFLVSRLRKIPLIYDSHEYFTEVPEIIHRPQVKRIWEGLEKRIVPKLHYAISVSDSISIAYNEKYNIDFITIRNLPLRRTVDPDPEVFKNYPSKYKIIYQGALNVGRGIELMIQAMTHLEDAILFLIGEGDIQEELKDIVSKENLNNKVVFIGKLPPAELHKVTGNCDLGLSLEEDLGLSYRYSLPNKIFDYIQSEIPVLCSDLPEMASIVNEHNIGDVLRKRDAISLAKQIRHMVEDGNLNRRWKVKLKQAAMELCWEKEELKLITLIRRVRS